MFKSFLNGSIQRSSEKPSDMKMGEMQYFLNIDRTAHTS